jgi:hypothetical protein
MMFAKDGSDRVGMVVIRDESFARNKPFTAWSDQLVLI